MAEEQEFVPRQEVVDQVGALLRRIAMLHFFYARTLMDELGKEKGEKLAAKAIHAYGKHIGNLAKGRTLEKCLELAPGNYQGDLPGWPWIEEEIVVDGETRERVHHCPLASEWIDLGDVSIGKIYCGVDQAQIDGFNPDYEYIHFKTIPKGDPFCESTIRRKHDG